MTSIRSPSCEPMPRNRMRKVPLLDTEAGIK